jgi:hypothetical protein
MNIPTPKLEALHLGPKTMVTALEILVNVQWCVELISLNKSALMVLQKNNDTHTMAETRNVSVLETGFTGQTNFNVGIQWPVVVIYWWQQRKII